MDQIKSLMLLGVLFCFRWTFTKEDTEVSCAFNQDCVLPCECRSSPDPAIHWIYMTEGNPQTHSYYENQDQLWFQDQRFRNRTSLFQDQISRGNCSLLLRGVKVQDEGRYKCYISTTRGSEESFINLSTEAPVSEVHIHHVGNWITCSSEGIYPEPGLTWSTIPPSNMELQTRTRVHQTEDQLYSISSSLRVPGSISDVSYSCTVRNQRNQKTASVNKPRNFLKVIFVVPFVAVVVGALILFVAELRKIFSECTGTLIINSSDSDGIPQSSKSAV